MPDSSPLRGSRGSGCANLDLEWPGSPQKELLMGRPRPTSMACPPCLPQDYVGRLNIGGQEL